MRTIEAKLAEIQRQARVDVWHDIMWSQYKGRVFSELHRLAREAGADFRFFQIAETDVSRATLTPVDLSSHDYPCHLLFRGRYEDIPKDRLFGRILRQTLRSDAGLIVLQGYGRPEYWTQAIIAKLQGRKIAAFCDSTQYDRRRFPFLKALMKRVFFSLCSGLFCYGQRSAEYIQSLGVPANRIWIRCQAAGLPATYTAASALEQRLELAPRGLQARYLFVGRLHEGKNIDVLLKAFAEVRRRHRDATLTLIGSGPEESSLRDTAQKLEVAHAVTFLGTKIEEQLHREYSRATCLILPSMSETWGLVVNEALSFGCPALTSDCCGCVPELIADGKTGFVVRTGDVSDLAHRMEDVLALQRDVSQTARTCIEHVAPYTPQRAAQQIFEGCMAILARVPADRMLAPATRAAADPSPPG